jgi:Leucine-rich repeat (LRR) protein
VSCLKKNITCLDLCDLRITKLDGIENLANLHCLNLSNNRLTTVKKLRTLKALTFLDISGNNITKVDDLPPLINELRAARNGLTCLGFCTKLQVSFCVNAKNNYLFQLLTRLNVSRNKLKSLKGIEQSKLLQIIIASDNGIKMSNNEIEIFAVSFQKNKHCLIFAELSQTLNAGLDWKSGGC